MNHKEILICAGTGCLSAGADKIEKHLVQVLKDRGINGDYPVKWEIKKTGCIGPCSAGPAVTIMPEQILYGNLKPSDVETIVDEHILKGKVVESLLLEEHEHRYTEQKFFKGQHKIALRNTGLIDPLNIHDYVAHLGYKALEKVLVEMTPIEVVQVIKDSGLRGRGGAGFPTGLKWQFTLEARADQKYVICNGDEGDPGAFMDRSILEGDPHSIIEAMAIAGYSIGANQGYVYVRAEYPLAIQNLTQAIEESKKHKYIGENLHNTGFSFDIEIRVGAGAFVCGEETALIASIEGNRGQPRTKPPFPAKSGLWGKPTVINNVETLANICPIILNGSEWFSNIGTEKSKGTKVFAVAGDVQTTGLIEVPMGTTLNQLVFQIAGGIPDGKQFKAVQIGGPSGATIPQEYLDLPIDYESLQAIGAIVGSGGLIIMNEDNCMVDVARYFLDFTQDESCGKCTPCRIGSKRMLDFLERITKGQGVPEDLETLRSLGTTIKETSLCGLGQTAPNPVLSTLRYFQAEYEAHIFEQKCPSRHCKALITSFIIDVDKCIGCGICIKKCPVDAISGERKQPHVIHEDKCSVCGACVEACPMDAIS